MNELQRQAYLDAMGVDCYIPRLQLPAAKISTLCAMPVMDSPEVVERLADAAQQQPKIESPNNTETETLAPTVSSARAQAVRALFDEPAKTVVRSPISVAEKVDSTGTSKPDIPQFSLSIIRGSNILIIDDALPGHTNPAEYLKLLQNMLSAIGDGRPQLTIDSFVWPMVKNAQVDQSETAARQTLESFLAKQVDQLNTRYILVMGDIAARYISLEPLPRAVFNKHPQLDAQLIHTVSAASMLDDPSIKRTVWQDLQPLHRVLKKH